MTLAPRTPVDAFAAEAIIYGNKPGPRLIDYMTKKVLRSATEEEVAQWADRVRVAERYGDEDADMVAVVDGEDRLVQVVLN